jgi:hypothetical protein
MASVFNPNQFKGTDSERIDQAVAAVKANGGGKIVISRREDADGRDFWLLDRAILLDSNMTLVIDDCTLKLSDKCRDNFIRSANCGAGIEKVAPIKNVCVVGSGDAKLVGADHPRATGDSGKKLGERTYGTDAGKEGESQTGDWRNIGILFANVDKFAIRNVTIVDAHAWSVSLEKCANGIVENLRFDSTETREIDGRSVKVLNVDGLDLRKGCRDVVVRGISGRTGDDLVAITAIVPKAKKGGVFGSTEVCDYSEEENLDVHNIEIRDVAGYAAGGHQIVRLLNGSGIKLYDVLVENVVDESPAGVVDRATVRIGDANPAWGGVTPLGDAYAFTIRNIESRSRQAILIAGSLADSAIENVKDYNPESQGVCYESGVDNVRNVRVEGVVHVDDAPVSGPKARD